MSQIQNDMNSEYIPYGPEWEKEMMRATKKELVLFIAELSIDMKRKSELIQKFIYDESHGEKEGSLL